LKNALVVTGDSQDANLANSNSPRSRADICESHLIKIAVLQKPAKNGSVRLNFPYGAIFGSALGVSLIGILVG
jgi:hypothetical protein